MFHTFHFYVYIKCYLFSSRYRSQMSVPLLNLNKEGVHCLTSDSTTILPDESHIGVTPPDVRQWRLCCILYFVLIL
ncbi:hypothetical protein J4Q44_G00056870, partial [Coregonus suidteri]